MEKDCCLWNQGLAEVVESHDHVMGKSLEGKGDLFCTGLRYNVHSSQNRSNLEYGGSTNTDMEDKVELMQ